jgi:hypothetical protein
LKNVVGLAEENLLRAIAGRFESVDDHVKRLTLQRGDERFPIAGHKLRAPAHRLGQSVDHLFFIADVLIGIGGIGEDVRRAATRISAPTQNLLRRRSHKRRAATKRHKKSQNELKNSLLCFLCVFVATFGDSSC